MTSWDRVDFHRLRRTAPAEGTRWLGGRSICDDPGHGHGVPPVHAVRGPLRNHGGGRGGAASCGSPAIPRTRPPRGTSAPRRRRSPTCTRTPTGCARRSSGSASGSCRSVGRGARTRRRRAAGGPGAPRQGRARHLSRQSRGPLVGGDRRRSAARTDRQRQQLLGDLGRPAAPASGGTGDVRPLRAAAGARHRSHRPHADVRRQPGGVERLDHDRAGNARAAAGGPRPRGARRRRRPAADRDGAPRLRARPGRSRAATPTCCSGCCTCCSPRTSPTSGGSAAASTAFRSSSCSCRDWSPERCRAPRRRRRRDDRAPGAGVRRRRAGRRLWPRRRLPAAHRDGDPLADQRAQRPHRPLRHRRRRDVHHARGRHRVGRRAGHRPGKPRRLPPAGERAAVVRRRAAGCGTGRRDPHSGRRAGAGDGALRRQPGPLDAGRGAARCGDGRARVVRVGRHVRDRDLPPRARDPAADLPPRARRRRRCADRRSQRATTSATTLPRCRGPTAGAPTGRS